MNKTSYSRNDFVNSNEVKWCPGCGDYAILAALQRALPELGLPPEQHVFVSGIGCAGRLPYYMNAYGFHTIHGRALAVATGLKTMRDDLAVWVITGDGDALSIGGNHLIHCLRRNVNVNILLVNNQVYGLTKGQYSPTSTIGQITKTSPSGVNHQPMNPLTLALASGATFVARSVDKDPNHLASILKRAYEHKGCSLIEIYQDCNIFNHKAFDAFSLKENRPKNTVLLSQDKPLLFGENNEHGLVFEDDAFLHVDAEQAQSYRHDEKKISKAMRLAELKHPEHPVPLGVFYQHDQEMFQFECKIHKSSDDLAKLYRSKAAWVQ